MITIIPKHTAREVMVSIPKHMEKHQKALRDSLHDIGQEVKREAKRLIMSPPKTGRWYGSHQASAPGEAPANRTGRLAKSGGFRVRNHVEMEVGEKAYYAKWLEDGTKIMEPRPHLKRAVDSKAQDGINIILRNVDRELK